MVEEEKHNNLLLGIFAFGGLTGRGATLVAAK
jgi:hypothetical protein